ncbi:MAG: ATP-binding protein, partial [Promethearchaeota archaeon]
SSFATYDPNPIFTNEYIVQIYGRTWKFNLHSDKTFYAKNKNGQPILILLGGFFIDGLLFFIFIILTKKNKTAISFADKVSEELEEKNKNLKYRNKDLETLLHVSSHDLREPLRAIKNFSSMVNLKHSSGLNKRGKDLLFRIERGANKMENLLDDITSLSKAQRKKMEFEKINAKDLINPILEDMREEIEVSKSNIVVSDNLPEIIVDKVWAYRAIYNLISNSIKFTKEGEAPYILITPYISGDQSGVVIRDRGIGIREENCEKIFDLFRRDVGNEFEGTGAGLSIVRQIAIRHSGDAWAESVEGGSQFTISFLAKR